METDTEQVEDCKSSSSWRVLDFLQEEWAKEAAQREMYFSNGVKRYQYRTEEDKVKNCGRLISMYIGADGTQKERREYRCRLQSCAKCMGIRAKERTNDFSERIERVASEKPLFYLELSTKAEQRRFREAAVRRGYEYLIVPTGTEVRYVVTDGPVSGAEPIYYADAINRLKGVSGVIYSDRSKRVSGKLGKQTASGEATEENVGGEKVTVLVREYVFNGRKPTKAEIQIADVKAMSSASDILGDSGLITVDNAQALITKRENVLFRVYKLMGFPVHTFDPVEKEFDLDVMNKTWARVEIGKHRFFGNLGSLNPYARMLVSRAIAERNNKETTEAFEDEVELAAMSISGGGETSL
jgi:hypothetical protein